jgi:hypothetical protein
MSTSEGEESGRAEVWRARELLEDVEARLRAVEASLDAGSSPAEPWTGAPRQAATGAELRKLRTQAAQLARERVEAHDALGRALFHKFRHDLLALGRPFDDGSIPPILAARAAYVRRASISLLAPWPALAAEAEASFPITSARSPRDLQG